MSIIDGLKLFGGYFFRWIGFPVEPKLEKMGNPNEDSPVFLTCNFNITVKRVKKALENIDCYLLIAPSNGINVWCGTCGDDFQTSDVISIIKTSEIDKLVNHKKLILPQLSAPGIDPVEIKEKTGWKVKFGPVYAEEIPKYIENNYKKTQDQRVVKFPISKRFEMGHLYFMSIFLFYTIIFWIVTAFTKNVNWMLYLVGLIVFALVIYLPLLIFPSIQTNSSLILVAIFELIVIAILVIIYAIVIPNMFYLIFTIILSLIGAMTMSEDLHGLTPIYKSELGEKTWKKGKDKMKFLGMEYKLQPYGTIKLDVDKCIGCKVCIEVCPRNLYEFDDDTKKAILNHPENCINCNACVNRCLGDCLMIE